MRSGAGLPCIDAFVRVSLWRDARHVRPLWLLDVR
jgi:hypothetical protein